MLSSPYFVKNLRFDNGEDLPVLMDKREYSVGFPVKWPTKYITSMRRKNHSPQTIEKDCRCLMVLYTWALIRGIDLTKRFFYESFIDSNERSDLYNYSKKWHQSLLAELPENKIKNIEVIPFDENVSTNTHIRRLLVIREYLDWLAQQRLDRIHVNDADVYVMLDKIRYDIRHYFTNNMPEKETESYDNLPKGMPNDEERFLFSVIEPGSDQNPWVNKVVRERNYVMIMLFFELGIRRGELLCLKIQDITFSENINDYHNICFIAKRKDDPKDPRKIKPRQKTSSRETVMSQKLANLLREYITVSRQSLRQGFVRTLDHNFVFVSVEDGSPLSISSIGKIFSDLRSIPGMTQDLSSHTGRRTWNDRFSARADQLNAEAPNKFNNVNEKNARNALMGWAPNSEMGEKYSRRHITENALEYQDKLCDDFQSNIIDKAGMGNTIMELKAQTQPEDCDDIPF